MLVSCWSAKGGSGATVVAVALASLLARRSAEGAVLADLDGDVPAAVGLPDGDGPGVGDWLAAGADVPPDALGRLEVQVAPALRLLPAGAVSPAASPSDDGGDRGEVLAALLAADPRPVVADCGTAPTGVRLAVAAGAAHSLLVLRPCYLALRRAVRAPLRPSAVVLVDERARSITESDVEDALGVPVRAVVLADPAVARAVDAGMLGRRPPRSLLRDLQGVLP